MDHPADFIEPNRPLKSMGDLRSAFLASLPGGDSLSHVRLVWSEVSGQKLERSWPVNLEHGVLVVEAAAGAAQDLRLQASQIRQKLETLGIPVKKIMVEMEKKRG